jgi:hypothetical protein
MLQLPTLMLSLERFMCLFNSTELSYLEKTEPIATLKIKVVGSISFKNYHKSHRETLCYSLLILTQMGFVQEIHVFLKQLHMPIWNKESLSPL